MKYKKYIVCSGLAFQDQEDMERLHAYALEGWIFKEFKYLCYVLYKEEPQDLIFSYDITNIRKQDEADYYALFEEAGWKSVPCKDRKIHFFCAQAGTVPIHSQEETRNEQYGPLLKTGILIVALGCLVFLTARLLPNKNTWLAGVGGGLFGGGGMLVLGCYLRVNGKRWRFKATFRQSFLLAILGIIMWMGYQKFGLKALLKPLPIFDFVYLLVMMGCFFIGMIYMLTQYRIFRDKKE